MAIEWFNTWRLRINPEKTMAVLFNKRQTANLRKLKLNNHQIKWTNSVKYLGLIYDKNLKFSLHIKSAIQKATKFRGMLYPVLCRKSKIPVKTKLQIYSMYLLLTSRTLVQLGAQLCQSQTGQKLRPFKILLSEQFLLHLTMFPIQLYVTQQAYPRFVSILSPKH